jgi:hemoglobin
MTDTIPSPAVIASARPAMTAGIMAATDLDEAVLRRLVHRFYAKVRADAELGPIFASRITEWEPHLERMVAFWSSVALMTGRYHGRPVPAHAGLPVGWSHFERWLALFGETARETCSRAGAAHVIERAERIARSLFLATDDAARREVDAVPRLRHEGGPDAPPRAGGSRVAAPADRAGTAHDEGVRTGSGGRARTT